MSRTSHHSPSRPDAATPADAALHNVIFDVDGTLVDSVDLHARAWQEAFADFGYRVTYDDVRFQIGKGGDQLIPVFVPRADLDRVASDLDAHRSQLFAQRYLHRVIGFPAVRDLFVALREHGKRIALASSAKKAELDFYKTAANIADLVDVETSADEAERSKPHPDIFAAALQRLGDPPTARCVVVGDTPYDAEAASRAGLRCIGLLSGGFPEASLRNADCIAVYRDVAHLLATYQEQGDRAFTPGT